MPLTNKVSSSSSSSQLYKWVPGYRQWWKLWINCLHKIIAVWLKASQTHQIGVRVNMSARGRSLKCFDRSNILELHYIKTYLYLFIHPPFDYSQLNSNFLRIVYHVLLYAYKFMFIGDGRRSYLLYEVIFVGDGRDSDAAGYEEVCHLR